MSDKPTAQEKLTGFLKVENINIGLLVVSPTGRSTVAIDEALQDVFRGWQMSVVAEYQQNDDNGNP